MFARPSRSRFDTRRQIIRTSVVLRGRSTTTTLRSVARASQAARNGSCPSGAAAEARRGLTLDRHAPHRTRRARPRLDADVRPFSLLRASRAASQTSADAPSRQSGPEPGTRSTGRRIPANGVVWHRLGRLRVRERERESRAHSPTPFCPPHRIGSAHKHEQGPRGRDRTRARIRRKSSHSPTGTGPDHHTNESQGRSTIGSCGVRHNDACRLSVLLTSETLDPRPRLVRQPNSRRPFRKPFPKALLSTGASRRVSARTYLRACSRMML